MDPTLVAEMTVIQLICAIDNQAGSEGSDSFQEFCVHGASHVP